MTEKKKEELRERPDDDMIAAALGGVFAHILSMERFTELHKPLSTWKQHRTGNGS